MNTFCEIKVGVLIRGYDDVILARATRIFFVASPARFARFAAGLCPPHPPSPAGDVCPRMSLPGDLIRTGR